MENQIKFHIWRLFSDLYLYILFSNINIIWYAILINETENYNKFFI